VSKSKQRRRRRPLFRRRTPPGASPGTLVADPAAKKPVVRVMAYDSQNLVERDLRTPAEIDDLPALVERYAVTWVNIEGVGDADIVSQIGRIFGLHRLALEDVLNDHQRAKVESYGAHVFVVARMLEPGDELKEDQLGLFLGKRFVITFQHTHGDCFDSARERIRKSRGVIRNNGPDYLAYALLDAVVDGYFPALERFGDEIEQLEEAVINDGRGDLISQMHEVKRKLAVMRRAIWPLRDALHVLVRDPNPLIADDTRVYLRDCADHTFQIIDLFDNYRELTSDLMSLYHSSIANRTNEVMQVLTVIATIFIPLTFIVGVYGMNFNTEVSPWNMPELNWYWGYPIVWAIMVVVTVALLLFFQQKGWLPRARHRPPMPPEQPNNGKIK
jgi:magnesium transporter